MCDASLLCLYSALQLMTVSWHDGLGLLTQLSLLFHSCCLLHAAWIKTLSQGVQQLEPSLSADNILTSKQKCTVAFNQVDSTVPGLDCRQRVHLEGTGCFHSAQVCLIGHLLFTIIL